MHFFIEKLYEQYWLRQKLNNKEFVSQFYSSLSHIHEIHLFELHVYF